VPEYFCKHTEKILLILFFVSMAIPAMHVKIKGHITPKAAPREYIP